MSVLNLYVLYLNLPSSFVGLGSRGSKLLCVISKYSNGNPPRRGAHGVLNLYVYYPNVAILVDVIHINKLVLNSYI